MKTLTGVENFEKQDLNSILKNFSQNENVKFTELMQSIRMILSGLKVKLLVFFSLVNPAATEQYVSKPCGECYNRNR